MNQLRLCLDTGKDRKLQPGLCLITEGTYKGHVVFYGSIHEETGMAVCFLQVADGEPPNPVLVEHSELLSIEEDSYGETPQDSTQLESPQQHKKPTILH